MKQTSVITSSIFILIAFGLLGCTAAPAPVAPAEPTMAVEPEPTPIPLETVETGTHTKTLTHDGLERSYIIHVPEAANGPAPLPLLLNLHGFTGTSESQLQYADFTEIADREGVIVVYPQGTLLQEDTHWNVGSWTRNSTVDDVSFLSELIDEVLADYNVDSDRVYSIGHSNGGYMSFLLACQIGEKITAVASVSGTMTPETFADCDPAHPTPVLQIHGTSDTVVPYSGASWTKSVDDVIEYWIGFNEVDENALITEYDSGEGTTASSSLIRYRYENSDGIGLVEHIAVEKGGHEWPGQPTETGLVNLDVDINEEIWTFLAQFDLGQLEE